MKTPQPLIAPDKSLTAPLADDRATVIRVANAADISLVSARLMLRTGEPPQNLHVRRHYLRAVERELRRAHVAADVKA